MDACGKVVLPFDPLSTKHLHAHRARPPRLWASFLFSVRRNLNRVDQLGAPPGHLGCAGGGLTRVSNC